MAKAKKPAKKRWIQDAIKNPGALRAAAARAGAINAQGKIDADWLEEQASGRGKTAQRARLAMTLRKLAKKRKKG